MIRAGDIVPAIQPMTLFLIGRDSETGSLWVDRAPIVAWAIDYKGEDPPWPMAVGVSDEDHRATVLFLELEDGREYRSILDGQTFDTEGEAIDHAQEIFRARDKLKNPP